MFNTSQIWVSSAHSASGYFTVYGDESSTADHFDARLATGDTHTHYCRTGYVGFVRRTEMTQSDGGKRICSVIVCYSVGIMVVNFVKIYYCWKFLEVLVTAWKPLSTVSL